MGLWIFNLKCTFFSKATMWKCFLLHIFYLVYSGKYSSLLLNINKLSIMPKLCPETLLRLFKYINRTSNIYFERNFIQMLCALITYIAKKYRSYFIWILQFLKISNLFMLITLTICWKFQEHCQYQSTNALHSPNSFLFTFNSLILTSIVFYGSTYICYIRL